MLRSVNRFDTSATRGLQSPSASGSGKDPQKEKEKEREVTSTPHGRARSALDEITNAASSTAPRVGVDVMALKAASKSSVVVHKPVTRSRSAAQPPVSKAEGRAPRPPSKPPHLGRQLTVPKSPMLLSRMRSDGRMKVKSTEELEVERIEKERQALATKYKRKQQADGESLGAGEDGRSSKLLKTTRINAVGGGFTVGAEAADVVVGMRRSTRSSTREREVKGKKGAWKPKLTVPQSPALATNGRVRAPRYKSTEELQLEEIAKVRSAKGGLGKRIAAKAFSDQRSKSRLAPLAIPEPFNVAIDGARGAKSTTAVRPAVAAGTTTRSIKSVKSATAQLGQSTVFVEGPITRSRAHVVETKKRDKSCRLAVGAGVESVAAHPAEDKNERAKKITRTNARLRQATRGSSMLRGGAMRVMRTEAEEPEEAGQSTPGSAIQGHRDISPRASYDQAKSRGRSIFDSIAGSRAKKGGSEETKRPQRTPSRVTFEQLSSRDRYHNPLFEFKQS